jgi:uncharacterized Tic20 family protein
MYNQPGESLLGREEQPPYQPTSDERILAILSHILTLLGSFIPPLIIYLFKKDESKYVADHALESLNFQITLIICGFISLLLIIVLIGFLLMWFLSIAALVLVIVASIRASDNKLYRYPVNFRIFH